MERLKDFREQADECRSLAATAKRADYQSQLLDLAARWDALAVEREKLLEAQRKLQTAQKTA